MRIQIIKKERVLIIPSTSVLYNSISQSPNMGKFNCTLHLTNKEQIVLCERDTAELARQEAEQVFQAGEMADSDDNPMILVTVLYSLPTKKEAQNTAAPTPTPAPEGAPATNPEQPQEQPATPEKKAA